MDWLETWHQDKGYKCIYGQIEKEKEVFFCVSRSKHKDTTLYIIHSCTMPSDSTINTLDHTDLPSAHFI